MKTKSEIKKWILENCVNNAGVIDLSELNFGDKDIILKHIKAKNIYNYGQVAIEQINNNYQTSSETIKNGFQKSDIIWNNTQEAITKVANNAQNSKGVIDNERQEATGIYNDSQKSVFVFDRKKIANKIHT